MISGIECLVMRSTWCRRRDCGLIVMMPIRVCSGRSRAAWSARAFSNRHQAGARPISSMASPSKPDGAAMVTKLTPGNAMKRIGGRRQRSRHAIVAWVARTRSASGPVSRTIPCTVLVHQPRQPPSTGSRAAKRNAATASTRNRRCRRPPRRRQCAACTSSEIILCTLTGIRRRLGIGTKP